MPTLFGWPHSRVSFQISPDCLRGRLVACFAVARKEPQRSRGEKRSGGMGAPLIIRGLPRSLTKTAAIVKLELTQPVTSKSAYFFPNVVSRTLVYVSNIITTFCV